MLAPCAAQCAPHADTQQEEGAARAAVRANACRKAPRNGASVPRVVSERKRVVQRAMVPDDIVLRPLRCPLPPRPKRRARTVVPQRAARSGRKRHDADKMRVHARKGAAANACSDVETHRWRHVQKGVRAMQNAKSQKDGAAQKTITPSVTPLWQRWIWRSLMPLRCRFVFFFFFFFFFFAMPEFLRPAPPQKLFVCAAIINPPSRCRWFCAKGAGQRMFI